MVKESKITPVEEAVYAGNLGLFELIKFKRTADPEAVSKFNKLLKAGKTKEAWALVQRVLNVKLVGDEFN